MTQVLNKTPHLHPFSTGGRPIELTNAVAQCQNCKGISSYDAMDAYERKPLRCHSCGGALKLYGEVNLGKAA